DEASDSQVEYGLTTAYGTTSALNVTMVTDHAVSISGLAGSTVYHYRVRSRDAAGNLGTSGDFTFTTPAPPDTTPPVLSGVAASSVTPSLPDARPISDEASDSQVEYGLTTAYGNSSGLV